jgi:phthiodiolone/phenolphthiodiolone dimycocerosates ketoreductase
LKIKFGFNGVAFNIRDFIEEGVDAEDAGFYSMWVADHFTDIPPPYEKYEPWTILAAISQKTETIKLGTSATDSIRRHPASLAHSLATLDNLSEGRAIVGIGAGEAMNVVPYGMPWEDPPIRLERLEEFVKVMRLLWSSSYERPVDYGGKFYTLKNARLDLRPYNDRAIPIYIASLGSRKGLELVGRIADGWLPWFNTPETLRDRVKIINDAANHAGRSPNDVEKAAIVYLILTDDAQKQKAIMDSVKPEIVLHTSAKRLRTMGYDINADKSTNYSFQRCIASEKDGRRAKELGEPLPDNIARRFVVAGNPTQCVAQLHELVEAGASHFIIRDLLWAVEKRDYKTALRKMKDELVSTFA